MASLVNRTVPLVAVAAASDGKSSTTQMMLGSEPTA
jgi:hypothetical protein